MPKASSIIAGQSTPKASDMMAGGKKSPRERWQDYVIEQNSKGDEAMQFKEWYEKYQKEKG